MKVAFSDPDVNLNHYQGNCTLVAIRQILPLSITDKVIFETAIKYGFDTVSGHGMPWSGYKNMLDYLGIQTENLKYTGKRMTVAQFVKTYTTGTYTVGVSGHVFIVRDGLVVDPNYYRLRSRARVLHYHTFKILNDAYIAPVKKNIFRVIRYPSAAKRAHSKSWHRYYNMYNYTYGHPDASIEDIFENTDYTQADLKYDLAHGHVEII